MQIDIQRAQDESLRAMVESETWARTLGKWLEEGLDSSLREAMNATEIPKLHQAQGKWQAFRELKDQIDFVLQRLEARKASAFKRNQKELKDE